MDAGGREGENKKNKGEDELKLKFQPKGFIDFQAPHMYSFSPFSSPFCNPVITHYEIAERERNVTGSGNGMLTH